MKKVILNKKDSLLNNFISEIRDKLVQKDSMRFRRNINRIGEIFAYEISKELKYEQKKVNTPLGISKERIIKESPILATILRAGLPFHQGFLNYFDKSSNIFISAYRKLKNDEDFDIKIEYFSSPSINNKTIIICDPMLASGKSMDLSIKKILNRGVPKHIHICSIIASSFAIEYLSKNFIDKEITLWIGAEDLKINNKSYIIPGLGDAGDLSFGKKD